MVKRTVIHGEPYHAIFIDPENIEVADEGEQGEDVYTTDVYAIVRPAFSNYGRIIEGVVLHSVDVEEIATTRSTTALHIAISDKNGRDSRESRVFDGEQTITSILRTLNRIEDGSFIGLTDE